MKTNAGAIIRAGNFYYIWAGSFTMEKLLTIIHHLAAFTAFCLLTGIVYCFTAWGVFLPENIEALLVMVYCGIVYIKMLYDTLEETPDKWRYRLVCLAFMGLMMGVIVGLSRAYGLLIDKPWGGEINPGFLIPVIAFRGILFRPVYRWLSRLAGWQLPETKS